MPANPLNRAIDGANSTNKYLGDLFARIGSADHPRGIVPTAYRNAHRAMRSALRERNRVQAAGEVMAQLRASANTGLRDVLTSSQSYGVSYAGRQLELYGIEAKPTNMANDLLSQVQSGIDGVLSVIDQQEQVIASMLTVGTDTDLILGDEDRVGILRPGDVIAAATFWTAALVWTAFDWTVQASYPYDIKRIGKLAVAALDSRTTDCCLRVHGQTQPFNRPFELTGTPRYADRLDWAPFHRFCRTSVALYIADYDDGITQNMCDAASSVLAERKL